MSGTEIKHLRNLLQNYQNWKMSLTIVVLDTYISLSMLLSKLRVKVKRIDLRYCIKNTGSNGVIFLSRILSKKLCISYLCRPTKNPYSDSVRYLENKKKRTKSSSLLFTHTHNSSLQRTLGRPERPLGVKIWNKTTVRRLKTGQFLMVLSV